MEVLSRDERRRASVPRYVVGQYRVAMRARDAWPLVGRDAEVELGTHSLSSGSGIVLAGLPGVGKTRLADEIATRDAGRTWISIVASSGTSQVPFGVFAHLMGPTWGIAGDQFSTWRELGIALGLGSRSEVGFVVDDAQWLDPLSAGFVHHLAVTGRSALIVTLRSGEEQPEPVLALWKDDLLDRIEVQPLGRRDVEQLLEAVLGAPIEPRTAARFSERSAGNVLWLRELVEGARAAGHLQLVHGAWVELTLSATTPRLVELLAHRLAQLAPEERDAAELLALAGPLPWAVVDRLFDPHLVAGLEAAGLVRAGDAANLVLGHPLYGEVLLATAGEVRQRQLRTELADAFTAAIPVFDPPTAMRVAIWQIDAQIGVSPDVALAAADTALDLTAHATAERLARAAIGAGAGAAGLVRVGEALVLQHHHLEAAEALATVDIGELRPPDIVRYAIARSLALSGPGGHLDEAIAVLEAVMGSLGDDPSGRLVESHMARLLVDQGRISAGGDLADRLMAEADLAGDELCALRAMVPATIAMTVKGRCHDALAICKRLEPVALAHIPELPEAIAWIYSRRLHGLEVAGDLAACEELVALIESLGLAEHDPTVAAGTLLARGILASHHGRLVDGLRFLSLAAALHRVDDRRGTLAWCLASQARLHAQLGDGASATAAITEAWDRRWPDGQVFDTDLYVGDAWARRACGDLAGAEEKLAIAAGSAADQGLVTLEAYVRHEAIRLGADAAGHAARLSQITAGSQAPWDVVSSMHASGLADDDANTLAMAGEAFAELGLDLWAAETFAEAAASFTRQRLAARAAQSAQRCRTLLNGCQGAVTPRLRHLDGVEPALTRRELEIATKAALGQSSTAIAEELALSVRTVETHLQRAFVKLGVNRRQELALVLLPKSATR